MAQGKLFKYAVLFHPKVVKDLAGNETQEATSILVPESNVTAENETVVRIIASRAIPDTVNVSDYAQVEIVVRPF